MPTLEDLMQLLNSMGMRQDYVGNQVGNALTSQNDAAYLNNTMRDAPQFQQNQSMQNYLAPLEHKARIREHMMGAGGGYNAQTNPLLGTAALGASVPYEATKMMAGPMNQNAQSFPQDLAQQMIRGAGTGHNIKTSQPSLEALVRALQGYKEGMFPPNMRR